MPDFGKAPWSTVIEAVRDYVVPVVLIVIVAFVLLRAARVFIHGIVKALMDREATEGTAQELSAVELKKRMDTLDGLGANVLQFFIVIIAGLMVLRSFGLDIGPAVAGLGVVGVAVGFGAQNLVRDYLNGALILIENQFSKGDVIRAAGVVGHGRGLQPAADDAARPRRRGPHGAQRRDRRRQQPDARLVADQPRRDRRLRHRHRQGDRGRRRGRGMRWPPTRSGSAASWRRRGSTASPRSGSTA